MNNMFRLTSRTPALPPPPSKKERRTKEASWRNTEFIHDKVRLSRNLYLPSLLQVKNTPYREVMNLINMKVVCKTITVFLGV